MTSAGFKMKLINFFTIACVLMFLLSSCEEANTWPPRGKDAQSKILKITQEANIINIVESGDSTCELCSEYKLITTFSKRIQQRTGLFLSGYGINNHHPKKYQFKNGVHDFLADYRMYKTQQDVISLENARRLVVSVAEGFLQEINSNLKVRPDLDTYPIISDLIAITICFKDENHKELGNGGISNIFFSEGEIIYDRHEIHDYAERYSFPEGMHITDDKGRGYKVIRPPANKNITVHKESYADALDIVKRENGLMQL